MNKQYDTFTAIDFELANAKYNSVCAIGIVTVTNGEITNEFHSLVKPPDNKYMWQTTRVHGIKPAHTKDAPTFEELFPTILPLLAGVQMVAHNEKFDRSVLAQTLAHYHVDASVLHLEKPWICTSILYQSLGFVRTKLSFCCKVMDIELNHHDPLSDAKASALLYLSSDQAKQKLEAFELSQPQT